MKKLFFLMLITLSWPSFAQRMFDVEMIVFKRNVSAKDVQENWSSKPIDINMSKTIGYDNVRQLEKYGIVPLGKGQLELTNQYDEMLRSGKYKGLLHIGWRQNDNDRSKMPKIRLSAGKNYANEFHSKKALYALDGYIRLYVQHYLFLETDLMLRQPGEKKSKKNKGGEYSPLGPNANNKGSKNTSTGYERFLQNYGFKQKRRMRSGEVHYLDHPLMGIIIQVRKISG